MKLQNRPYKRFQRTTFSQISVQKLVLVLNTINVTGILYNVIIRIKP